MHIDKSGNERNYCKTQIYNSLLSERVMNWASAVPFVLKYNIKRKLSEASRLDWSGNGGTVDAPLWSHDDLLWFEKELRLKTDNLTLLKWIIIQQALCQYWSKCNIKATKGELTWNHRYYLLLAEAGPPYSHWLACAHSALTVCSAETDASQEPYAQWKASN